MYILKHKTILSLIAGAMIVISGSLVAIFGFNPSIDFAGGTIYEVAYTDSAPSISAISQDIQKIAPGALIQSTGEQGIIIKSIEISDEQKTQIDSVLSINETSSFEELRYKQLGAAISSELKNKSIFAILFVVLVIIGFIAYTFRYVSQPVSSFKYGLVAVVALVHDTIIPLGVFALLGSIFIDYQIDVLFVTALLATLGYSLNDTIVVFDRVRENLRLAHENHKPFQGDDFEKIVATSLEQTFKRSFYTSVTTLTALGLLFFLGGEATQAFALVLGIGVVAGTYSSLFLACPLLVLIEKRQKEPSAKLEVDDETPNDDLPDDIQRFLAKKNK